MKRMTLPQLATEVRDSGKAEKRNEVIDSDTV